MIFFFIFFFICVISAGFIPLNNYYILIAAHYCVSFSVRLIIALNMFSWMWPILDMNVPIYALQKQVLIY